MLFFEKIAKFHQAARSSRGPALPDGVVVAELHVRAALRQPREGAAFVAAFFPERYLLILFSGAVDPSKRFFFLNDRTAGTDIVN